jgi:hypothetical protein
VSWQTLADLEAEKENLPPSEYSPSSRELVKKMDVMPTNELDSEDKVREGGKRRNGSSKGSRYRSRTSSTF